MNGAGKLALNSLKRLQISTKAIKYILSFQNLIKVPILVGIMRDNSGIIITKHRGFKSITFLVERTSMNSSLSLSIELIYLMGWLLKNEKSKLNALVKQAMNDGLAYDLQKLNDIVHEDVSDHLHKTVLNFLTYMEEALANNLDGLNLQHDAEEVILPALNNLEEDSLNDNTLQVSIQRAKADLQREVETGVAKTLNPEHAKQILFKHILENWQPNNEEILN